MCKESEVILMKTFKKVQEKHIGKLMLISWMLNLVLIEMMAQLLVLLF